MSHLEYQRMMTRARKAGLNTNELYAALSSRPAEGNDRQPGTADGNGYVSEIHKDGRVVYRPLLPPETPTQH